MIFKGIQTSIAKKPYIFVIFQVGGGGGGPDPLSSALDPHMVCDCDISWLLPFCYTVSIQQGSYTSGKCQGNLYFFKVRELSGNFMLCQGKMNVF